MKILTERSKQDPASESTRYTHELGLQLLQINKDEQAQEEYRLLSVKFRKWPYKLYQSWLILGFTVFLVAECSTLLFVLWQWIRGNIIGIVFIYYLLGLLVATSLLPYLYGCGQMLYAVRKRRSGTAQEAMRKFQYSMIIFASELIVYMWSEDLEDILSPSYALLIFSGMILFAGSQLIGGFAVVKVFQESERMSRQKTCDASFVSGAEETDPYVKDFLKQNEILQEEILKYDRQLERPWAKIFRFWLKFMSILEITRLLWNINMNLVALMTDREDVPGQNSAAIALMLFSSLCSYSYWRMEAAIAKKLFINSAKALRVLKVCVAASVITFFLTLRAKMAEGEDGSFGVLVMLILLVFGFCILVPVVILIGAIKVHRIIKERDHFEKFSSVTDASAISHL